MWTDWFDKHAQSFLRFPTLNDDHLLDQIKTPGQRNDNLYPLINQKFGWSAQRLEHFPYIEGIPP